MDKLRRASAWSGLVEAGRVYFGPGQSELTNAMLAVPPQQATDSHLWDLVDACGIVVRQFPAVPPAYEGIGARERSEQGKKLAASYATRSANQMLPTTAPRTESPAKAQGGQKLWGLHRDRRARAIGYSVRPSRLTTVKAPGRA